MNILTKLYEIYIRIIQWLGLSPKTYSVFRRLPRNTSLKAKGHLLTNPTDEQIERIHMQMIRKTRVEQWAIEDNSNSYLGESGEWPIRSEDIIDTIVITATDSSTWGANEQHLFDTSKKNSITWGKPLPGISCHLFITPSSITEKTSEFTNVIHHTPGANLRSLCIMIQYTVSNNNSAPLRKITQSLERTLATLCLEFKLNPYKAIKGQKEVAVRWIPFLKGRRHMMKIMPGPLVDLNALRTQVAVQMMKKLKYAGVYEGNIDGKFTGEVKRALNNFRSDCVKFLYNKFKIKKLGDTFYEQ